jgi:hypothetical protein
VAQAPRAARRAADDAGLTFRSGRIVTNLVP